MPNHYVEDYEALTGKKPTDAAKPDVMTTAKVVEAPAKAPAKKSPVKATTKAK